MRRFVVDRTNPRWREVVQRAADCITEASAVHPVDVRVSEYVRTRTLEQNAHLWALLHDIAEQVEWYGVKLSAEDWKDLATAALRKARIVPGIDGGFVAVGLRTSKMTRKEMTDLIDFLYAFGIERGVKFTC